MNKDLLIIGGGPGGYIAAVRAAQLGAKVLLIEQNALGGTCLHRGCIPTKAFYKNAEVWNTLKKADEFGIQLSGCSLDMAKVQARKQDIVQRLHTGIIELMKMNSVEVCQGTARLLDSHRVEVTDSTGDKEVFSGKYILIATGSQTSALPIPGADLPGVLNSDQVLELREVPPRMIIIGGGVIGVEFAGILQSLGSQVTIIELLPRILPTMDEEIVKRMAPLIKKKGIRVETGVRVQEIRQTSEGLTVTAKDKKESEAAYTGDIVLISTGRTPNTSGLGLDDLGIEYSRRGIQVDTRFQTTVPGIYAIGDVLGGQMLAHVASHQGTVVVENLFGGAKESVSPVVPACVFSFPELASVGLTEEEVKAQGIPYTVSKSMFGANGKALTLGEGEGLIKVLAQQEDKSILGVHILGPHASDLIHEAALAIHQNLSAEDIRHMIHAHPTLAETFHEAILGL